MSKLNQVIATEHSVKTRAQAAFTQLYQLLQKPSLLSGLTKTYQPHGEEELPPPPEHQRVQVSAAGALVDARNVLTELFDIRAQVDWANQRAIADVVVDGKTVLKDVPVTYLMFLEKKLTDLHTFISKLPVLDPAEEWRQDSNTHLWVTEPTMTVRTKKLPVAFEKAPATKEHPAQVEVVYEDKPVGRYLQVKMSGAMEAARVKVLTSRVEALSKAVKSAREAANSIEAPEQKCADKLFDLILAP